ncbi:RNA recognition motif-containing protein [Cyclospora cayetanensis]|uniref:RNA recognition motif-containing protein n=1 Tax=Cyclospora cayetanensis TaxID=88456 RepID=A0A1D3CW91_9EIME|nr:RNA recognition motif-containing protein [Cyclospora cayetanensis]
MGTAAGGGNLLIFGNLCSLSLKRDTIDQPHTSWQLPLREKLCKIPLIRQSLCSTQCLCEASTAVPQYKNTLSHRGCRGFAASRAPPPTALEAQRLTVSTAEQQPTKQRQWAEAATRCLRDLKKPDLSGDSPKCFQPRSAAERAYAECCVYKQRTGTRAHTEGTRQLLHNFDYKQLQEQRNRCTVFLTGFGPDVTESELRLVFAPFGQIKAVDMPRHEENNKIKGFGFIEFAQEESAEMAIKAMDGFPFKGRELVVRAPLSIEERNALREKKEELANAKDLALKLRRTKQPTEEIRGLFGTVPFHESQCSKPEDIVSHGRVVKVANIPATFGEEDVKQIMDVFGPIMAVNVIPHLQEALVHYYQKGHAAQAVATMDGFLVGERRLSVMIDRMNGQRPSSLIVLKNLVHADEVDDQLKKEIFDQCRKYGQVREVTVHVVEATKEVRVFTLFRLPEEANRALRILPHRKFNKKPVQCELYDYDAYCKHRFNI